MAIFKTAQLEITPKSIHNSGFMVSNKPMDDLLLGSEAAKSDKEVRQRFVKFAQNLKRVSPKAKDFLFFSAIMMHAAEAALVDQNTGFIIKKGDNDLTSEWIINNKGSWKWKCSDNNIKPYKNNNGDIFPEIELKKAYRKWIGRPLCKDHQSSSVDGIRGIIVDTFYDDKRKRVIALCALDKVNYPDLARKVSTGYATNVSMGTAVGRSICYECGNVAKIESDYCSCVKNRSTYGEINIDLSPIELSLVVTGADPKAHLRSVIASLDKYSSEKGERIDELKKAGCVTPSEITRLENEISDLRQAVREATNLSFSKAASLDPNKIEEARNLSEVLKNLTSPEARTKVESIITNLLSETQSAEDDTIDMGFGRQGEYPGASEDSGPPQWSPERTDVMRMSSNEDLGIQINAVNKKLDAMEHVLKSMAMSVREAKTNKEEQSMSDKELRQRAAARRAMFQKSAYHQGGGDLNDPASLPYPVDGLNDQLKTKGDKQMEGQGMEPGNDGLHPGYDSFGQSEESLKKMLSRAELDARKNRRHSLLKSAEDVEQKEVQTKSGPQTVAKLQDGTIVSLNDDGTYQKLDDEQIQHAMDIVKLAPRGNKKTKEAYWQGGGGVNEPQTYSVDPLNDKLKTDGDKQMEGQGMEPGNDGMHPGYESTGRDEDLKKKLLRAQLRAKFVLAYKNDEKTVIDKENSRWEIYAGPEKILTATGKEIYEDELEKQWEVLASRQWGKEVIRAIREDGFSKVAWLVKGEGFSKVAGPEDMPPMPGAPGAPPAEEVMPPMPPMPGAPEEGEEDKPDLTDAADPVQEALDGLTEHLEGAEKTLGDLKDVLQEVSGKTEGADLPDVGGAEADDNSGDDGDDDDDDDDADDNDADDNDADDNDADDNDADDNDDIEHLAVAEAAYRIKEVYAGLDESADELAMLAESLESRFKAGKTANDAVTAELLRLTSEALNENVELRKEASLVVESAKKGLPEGLRKAIEAKKEKGGKKKSSEKGSEKGSAKKSAPAKKSEKGSAEKGSAKKSAPAKKSEKDSAEKKSSGKKSEKDEKASGKGKKSKAELMLENLLKARATKRRELIREADGEEMFAADDEVSKLRKEVAKLKEMLEDKGSFGDEPGFSDFGDEGDLEVGEGDLEDDLEGDFEGDEGDLEGDEGDLDSELAQMLDDLEMGADDLGLSVDASARKSWRERIAAEVGAKYQLSLDPATTVDSDVFPKFHPQGGHDLERLDINPSDKGAYFETIVEQHEEIMRQVQNLPKVREAMAHLGSLLKSGSLNFNDLDNESKLLALAVDPDAAKYWKTYFSEGDSESGQFGVELTKEYSQKKAQASLDEQRIKMARAYDIALDMQEKGMISGDRSTLDKQVNEIMSFDNKSFESFKRALSRVSSQVKTAAPALNVGLSSDNLGGGEVQAPVNLANQLTKMW